MPSKKITDMVQTTPVATDVIEFVRPSLPAADANVKTDLGTATPLFQLVTVTSLTSASSPYSAAASCAMYTCDASGGAITVNLPAASGAAGVTIDVKKTDASANSVTVDGNASETIDGALSLTISSQYDTYTLRCDGSAWWVV